MAGCRSTTPGENKLVKTIVFGKKNRGVPWRTIFRSKPVQDN